MEISNNKNIKILQPTGNIAERLLEYHNKVMIEASKLREDSFNQSQNKLRQHTFCKSFPLPPPLSIYITSRLCCGQITDPQHGYRGRGDLN